jgi:hypothetical protein
MPKIRLIEHLRVLKKYISCQKDFVTSQPQNTKITIQKPDIEDNRAVIGPFDEQNENAVSSPNPIPKPKPVTVAISKIRNSIDRALTNRRTEVSKLRGFKIPYPVPVKKPIVTINKADLENNLGETGVKRDGFCFLPISPKLII